MTVTIGRRELLAALGGAAVAWPLAARAQQAAMPVVGFLRSTPATGFAYTVDPFRQGLNDAGIVEDCSPIAPSAGVPTGCRRTLAAARRSAIAPAGSKDGLRSRKAAKGYGSARPTHRAQASGSSSADGSPAPAPQAKCTKTADPDPKIPPACKPPPIRDTKTESANPRYGEAFFSKLLVVKAARRLP